MNALECELVRTLLGSKLKSLNTYLKESEALLIDMILHAQNKGGKPVSPDERKGDVEYGLVPYWVHKPPEKILKYLDQHALGMTVVEFLQCVIDTPTVSEADYQFLLCHEKSGLVADDGTYYATQPEYAQLDPDWLWAAFNYLINVVLGSAEGTKILRLLPGKYRPIAPFGMRPCIDSLKSAAGGTIKIAIVGDWGTGVFEDAGVYGRDGPAVAVIKAIKAMCPNYVIHLGDVYYCGTDDRLPPGEEQNNFLALWSKYLTPVQGTEDAATDAPLCFTLNSNHEMYGGAYGYFRRGVAVGCFQAPERHQLLCTAQRSLGHSRPGLRLLLG